VICKIHGRWEVWFAKVILQITPPISYEHPIGSTLCDSNWSFHSLHGEVSFHPICCPLEWSEPPTPRKGRGRVCSSSCAGLIWATQF
jgi:hypothetical protein